MTYRPESCNSQAEGFSEVVYRYARHWDVGYIPEWAKYQAVDEDGTEYFYEFEPIPCGNGKWLPSQGRCIKRLRKISNWKETLSERKMPHEIKEEIKKKNRVKEGRGRPKKKKERAVPKKPKVTLADRVKAIGVFRNTESFFNDYLKRYLIVKTVNGKKLYCRGSTQDFNGDYAYRFTEVKPNKPHPKLKYYTSEKFARNIVDLIVESGYGNREELSIEFYIYEEVNGELKKSTTGMALYRKYLKVIEQFGRKKENNNE